MKTFNTTTGEQISLVSISDLEDLVRKMEAKDTVSSCTIEVDGGTGSTLLNIMLPDFTETEELDLLRIYNAACERMLRDCEDSIMLCNRRLADLQGFKVIQCGKGGGQE